MKLAVKKELGEVPGTGYHYMLLPKPVDHEGEAAMFETIGYHIMEVENELGNRLIRAAGAALGHQVELAMILEDQIRAKNAPPTEAPPALNPDEPTEAPQQ